MIKLVEYFSWNGQQETDNENLGSEDKNNEANRKVKEDVRKHSR